MGKFFRYAILTALLFSSLSYSVSQQNQEIILQQEPLVVSSFSDQSIDKHIKYINSLNDPSNTSMITPYAETGMTKDHINNQTTLNSITSSNPPYGIGAGISYMFNKHFSVSIGYRYDCLNDSAIFLCEKNFYDSTILAHVRYKF